MKNVKAFIVKWCNQNNDFVKFTRDDITKLEHSLGSRFPDDLTTLFLNHGAISPSLSLLDRIVETHSSLNDLNQIYDFQTIEDQTKGWREMGLESDHIAIASDCTGNIFCTPIVDPVNEQLATAEIWFFDHELGSHEKLFDSVEDWFGSYLNIRFSVTGWLIAKFFGG